MPQNKPFPLEQVFLGVVLLVEIIEKQILYLVTSQFSLKNQIPFLKGQTLLDESMNLTFL
jgi:hypothetical protein